MNDENSLPEGILNNLRAGAAMGDSRGFFMWAISDRMLDGSYFPAVQVSQDRSIPLDGERWKDYALTLLQAAVRAQHDAAVVRQALSTRMPKHLVALMLKELRTKRPPLRHDHTAPLRFEPVVTPDATSAINMSLDGKPVGQLSVKGAREHASAVLTIGLGVELDQAYADYLQEVGLDAHRAALMVDGLMGQGNTL